MTWHTSFERLVEAIGALFGDSISAVNCALNVAACDLEGDASRRMVNDGTLLVLLHLEPHFDPSTVTLMEIPMVKLSMRASHWSPAVTRRCTLTRQRF